MKLSYIQNKSTEHQTYFSPKLNFVTKQVYNDVKISLTPLMKNIIPNCEDEIICGGVIGKEHYNWSVGSNHHPNATKNIEGAIHSLYENVTNGDSAYPICVEFSEIETTINILSNEKHQKFNQKISKLLEPDIVIKSDDSFGFDNLEVVDMNTELQERKKSCEMALIIANHYTHLKKSVGYINNYFINKRPDMWQPEGIVLIESGLSEKESNLLSTLLPDVQLFVIKKPTQN